LRNARIHLRPLLTLKKAEIVAGLETAGATWREDSSNAGSAYFRNRVRHEVLPAWTAAAQRDALAGAARSRLLLDEDDTALEAWLDAIEPWSGRGRLDLRVLAGQPRAILRRALHRWVAANPSVGELSRQAFDSILDSLETRKATRHSVGPEGFAVTDRTQLFFEKTGKAGRNFQRRAN
jgi:tRNA(Ile)-lysidine synthase